MRLLVDLQCLQSTSAVRGIGRYALPLTRALVNTRADVDRVEVLLHAADDQEQFLGARLALETFLPSRAIHVFDAPFPWHFDGSESRRLDAEGAWEAAIRSLRPDALLLTSVFERDDETVLSVSPGGIPTAAVLYDLIPAAEPGTYLMGPEAHTYWRRYRCLQNADQLLTISEYTAREARRLLGPACPPSVNISGAPYPSGVFPSFEERAAYPAAGMPDRYVLAVGGDHPRKNLDGLIAAWGRVPLETRAGTVLAVACRLSTGSRRRLAAAARRAGLGAADLLLTGEVSETELVDLYASALAFVFPSLEEGLGLPPLEAMAAGCPTIMARGSSLSELADAEEAFFDGTDVADMSRALRRLLVDSEHRARLQDQAAATTEQFTWTRTAATAWSALRELRNWRWEEPVGAKLATEFADLVNAPDAVLVSTVPAEVTGVPADVIDAERQRGLVSVLDASVRAALSPSAALVAPDANVARALVEGGLAEQPVVSSVDQLVAVARHDVWLAHRQSGVPPTYPRDLISALRFPPRWSLQRPWPVWLLVTNDLRTPAQELRDVARRRGACLLIGTASAAVFARSVDVLFVADELWEQLTDDIRHARCFGAAVILVGGDGMPPAWAFSAENVYSALQGASVEQRTGWPWR